MAMLLNGYFISGQVTDAPPEDEHKRLVVFPAGKYTRLLLQFCRPDNLYCLCDNNISLHGTAIGGVRVTPLETLAQEGYGLRFLVTSPELAPALARQLASLGMLERCEITVCNWGKLVLKNFYDPFTLEDRRKGHKRVLIVLAGYKEKLWDVVFKRIARFAPSNMDVCVSSSGKYVDALSGICAENGWSYLSTSVNNVSLIQNIAIMLHPNAEYVYKLDEDIFICEGFFEGLMDTFTEAERTSRYHVGMVVPMIPVNPHGYVRFLEKMGLLNEFERRFGEVRYDFYPHFGTKTNETLYLWQHTLPLDKTAKQFRDSPASYYVCPHRFSIGAILFKRTLWEDMGGFTVKSGAGMGRDEQEFSVYFLTMVRFYTYIMSENVLAGHYSFGRADDIAALDAFYQSYKRLFDIVEDAIC